MRRPTEDDKRRRREPPSAGCQTPSFPICGTTVKRAHTGRVKCTRVGPVRARVIPVGNHARGGPTHLLEKRSGRCCRSAQPALVVAAACGVPVVPPVCQDSVLRYEGCPEGHGLNRVPQCSVQSCTMRRDQRGLRGSHREAWRAAGRHPGRGSRPRHGVRTRHPYGQISLTSSHPHSPPFSSPRRSRARCGSPGVTYYYHY